MFRVSVFAAVVAALLCSEVDAWATGYATDDRGRLYRVYPNRKEVDLVGTVKVPVTKGGKTVREIPTLTDLALHHERGMYGISFTHLYRIDVRDPANSKRVGRLGSSSFARFNALEFTDDGRLFAAGGGELHQVDIRTGKATKVGAFGVTGSSDGDLAWVEKTMYLTLGTSKGCSLAKVDLKTGAATSVGLVRRADKSVVRDVWGLIWDARTLWAVTPRGDVLALDRKTAAAKPKFKVGVTFWGACPMLRI